MEAREILSIAVAQWTANKEVNMINKFLKTETKGIDKKNFTVSVKISDESVDLDGEVIKLDAWKEGIPKFMKHPILVSSHMLSGLRNQIGKVEKLEIKDGGLWATLKYFVGQGNEEADWGWFLVQEGIASYSVGFIAEEVATPETESDVRRIYLKVQLKELSQVLLPANENAIQENQNISNEMKELQLSVVKSYKKYKETLETKGVIPYKKYPLADVNAKWDGKAEVKKADVKDLIKMCAWYDDKAADPDGDGYPDAKSAYKLPHHTADGYKTVWAGVRASMAALFGARGGVKLPAKDKKGVYNHLASHYKDFDKTPPDFKKEFESEEEILKACGYEDEEIKELLQEEKEPDNINIASLTGKIDTLIEQIEKQNELFNQYLSEISHTQPETPEEETQEEEKEETEKVILTKEDIKKLVKETVNNYFH